MDNKTVMQAEAQIILDLLRKRDVRVRINGGYKTPGFFVYEIEMDATQRFEKLEATLDDMERLLYAHRVKQRMIDANDPEVCVVCRVQRQPLTLEVNRPQIDKLPLEDIKYTAKPYVALAGMSYLTREGQPLTWNMADPSQPHALVAGGTGSGKSILLLDLVLSVSMSTGPHQLGLFVVDGGNSTLLTLRMLPHLQLMATDVDGAINAVAQVKAIVLDRKSKSETDPEHRCLLVVDELANLIAVMDKKQCEDFQRDLAVIAAEGRKFGVHMLVCTQKPLAETTGSLAKSNMAVRFVGAMASKTDANTAAGSPGTGAERLAGKGDFLRVIGGRARRFQAPIVETPFAFVRRINVKWQGTPVQRQPIAIVTPAQQVESNRPTPPKLSIANVLQPVIDAHNVGGEMRRGFISAAVTALNGGELPTGTTFQRLKSQVEAYLLTYFGEKDEKIIRFPQKKASGM